MSNKSQLITNYLNEKCTEYLIIGRETENFKPFVAYQISEDILSYSLFHLPKECFEMIEKAVQNTRAVKDKKTGLDLLQQFYKYSNEKIEYNNE